MIFNWSISISDILTLVTMVVGASWGFGKLLIQNKNLRAEEKLHTERMFLELTAKIDHLMMEMDALQFKIGTLWGWYERSHHTNNTAP